MPADMLGKNRPVKENAPGILTNTLASDAQVINGASAEGLASMLEGLCSLLLGIGLAFLYSWRMSLVCVGVSPFMLLGAILNFKIMEGFSDMNQ